MQVYRIEDEEGEGMYYSSRVVLDDLPNASERHPMPDEDSLLVENMERAGIVCGSYYPPIRDKYIFGFTSISQLRSWLHEDRWLTYLDSCKLLLSVYDVPDNAVIVGHTQLIFKRNESVGVIKHSIAEFFGL